MIESTVQRVGGYLTEWNRTEHGIKQGSEVDFPAMCYRNSLSDKPQVTRGTTRSLFLSLIHSHDYRDNLTILGIMNPTSKELGYRPG